MYNTIYIYENDQWSLFDTMPDYSNWDIKLVRSADDVYIISGWQSNGGAIKKYNLATKVWTNLTRSVNLIQNYGTTAQLVGNKIYHFGSHGEVDVYDINLNSWSLKSQNTINYGYEYSLSSALYNGEIYVTGYADSIIYKYNTINDTWYNVYQMNMALTGSSLFVYNDQLYLCGGFDSDHYPRVLLDNTFIFNLSNKSWKDASFKMSQGLYFHSTVLKNNTLYIIGGLDLNDEAVNLFQQFTL